MHPRLTRPFLFSSLLLTTASFAQNSADSLRHLGEVEVKTTRTNDVQPLPEILGTAIYAGKKTHVVNVDAVPANLSTNNMRQVLAKVPGIQIWESDASGIQTGISTRGLSPNRSWEFNMRQNGADIAADPFGYPEAYYTPPLHAVKQMQIVRGAGALQYGPQFGGMVNYVLRDGSEFGKPFNVQSEQTVGSYGLFNSYNALGGATRKLHYYAAFDHRQGAGWRDNSAYQTNTGFATLTYAFTPRLSLTGEVLRFDMRSQQAGGLTDAQFARDAQQSLRGRNWISTPWTTSALTLRWRPAGGGELNVKVFGMAGDRSSVGFMAPITARDSVNMGTGQQNNREVAIDHYRNWGTEARFLQPLKVLGRRHELSGGLRFYSGDTRRFQKGKGTTGSDMNFNIVDAQFPNELQFQTRNGAAFVEGAIHMGGKLMLMPGLRAEWIQAGVSGRQGFRADGAPNTIVEETRTRRFLLAGLSAEYHLTRKTELYGNLTQAYRPMLFSDLSALPTTDVIDPNLKDATGYNADLGCRGTVGDWLRFDVSAFYLSYANRIGTLTQQRTDGSFYNLRTNVGQSKSRGVEAFVEAALLNGKTSRGDLRVFGSYSFTDAQYGALQVIIKNAASQLAQTTLEGKQVENAPRNILRNGATYSRKRWSLTWQTSYVDAAFSNANNTATPTADGTNGTIPSYLVHDLTGSANWGRYTLRAGINNLSDARYFTRRSGGYPGPGLLPAEGRNVFVGIGVKL